MPVETITKRTAGESVAMLRMGLRNVARSGRMKPDWAATLKATKGYVCALPRFFNGMVIHFKALLPVASLCHIFTWHS